MRKGLGEKTISDSSDNPEQEGFALSRKARNALRLTLAIALSVHALGALFKHGDSHGDGHQALPVHKVQSNHKSAGHKPDSHDVSSSHAVDSGEHAEEDPHIEPHEVHNVRLTSGVHHNPQGVGVPHHLSSDMPGDSGSDAGSSVDSGSSISSSDAGQSDNATVKQKRGGDKRNSEQQNPAILSRRREDISGKEKEEVNIISRIIIDLMGYFKHQFQNDHSVIGNEDLVKSKINEIDELMHAIEALRDIYYERPDEISKYVIERIETDKVPVQEATEKVVDDFVFELLFAKHGDYHLVEEEKVRLRQFIKIAMYCASNEFSPEETYKVLAGFNDGHWELG